MSELHYEYDEAITCLAIVSYYVDDKNDLVDKALQVIRVGFDVGFDRPPYIELGYAAPWPLGPRVRMWLTPENEQRLLSAIKCAHLLADAPQPPPPPPPPPPQPRDSFPA